MVLSHGYTLLSLWNLKRGLIEVYSKPMESARMGVSHLFLNKILFPVDSDVHPQWETIQFLFLSVHWSLWKPKECLSIKLEDTVFKKSFIKSLDRHLCIYRFVLYNWGNLWTSTLDRIEATVLTLRKEFLSHRIAIYKFFCYFSLFYFKSHYTHPPINNKLTSQGGLKYTRFYNFKILI